MTSSSIAGSMGNIFDPSALSISSEASTYGMTAVIDLADPLLQADIMMSISMTLSLTLLLPLWTMKTSWSRIEVSMLTEVSPLLNFLSSAFAGDVPRRSQMASTKSGWEDPEKIFAPLIARGRQTCTPSKGNTSESYMEVPEGKWAKDVCA